MGSGNGKKAINMGEYSDIKMSNGKHIDGALRNNICISPKAIKQY